MATASSGHAEEAAAPAQDSAVPFGALLIFLSVLLLAPQAYVPGLGRVHVALLVGAFAVAAHCWTRFAAGRPLTIRTREIWLVGALLVWAAVTLPFAVAPEKSAQVLFNDYLKTLGVFWLLANSVTTLGRLRAVAWALSMTAAPLAAVGVWHFFVHTDLVPGRIVGYNASSLVTNPNDLALALNLILPLTAALFLIARRPAARGLLAGLIALEASGIVVTFSRGGFMTLATSLLLYVWTLRKRREWRWAVAALVLAVAAVPLLPSGYLTRLGTIIHTSADPTGSAQNRLSDAQMALTFALTHPLVGVGLRANAMMLDRIKESSDRPATHMAVHNVYLAYAMDLGWPGVALFLLLLISAIRRAARVRDRSSDVPGLRELFVLAEAVRITLVVSAVAACFDPNYFVFYYYYPPALAVAAGAVFEAETRTAGGEVWRTPTTTT